MKFTFILLAFVFSFGTFAQGTWVDPCSLNNLSQLLAGGDNAFHSRVEANECLKRAKETGNPVTVIPGKKPNTYGFVFPVGEGGSTTRYLKLNKKDFFLTNTLLGHFKTNDTQKDGIKLSSKNKFDAKVCVDYSVEICGSMTPPQDFNSDYCKCETKETLYCGDQKLTFDQKKVAKDRCDKREDYTWTDGDCSCEKVTFCGTKEWSQKKKERETESCLGKEGREWDDESCSCNDAKYCDGKFTLKQLKVEENKCSKLEKWNPETCACEGDSTKKSCKGKTITLQEMEDKNKQCVAKSTATVHYSWDEDKCSCDKEKVTLTCGGEIIGQTKYDRKRRKCEERIAKDDRWKWDDNDKCDCIKEEETENDPLCDGKRMPQRKYDRKKSHCDKIKGTWDTLTCKCDDPCYEAEEWEVPENETCTDTVPKLGDVEIDDLGAKICEKAIPDAEKAEMKKQCKEKVEAIYNQSTDKIGMTPIAIEIDYTSKGQVLCDDKIVAVESKKEIEQSLPSNVPTTDPNAFSGGCPGTATLKGDLNKYHPTSISCEKMESVKAGHDEIVAAANDPLTEFFTKLNIQGPISKEEMDKILNASNFNLEVIGTANRSNNGTGITLDELALKRKQEAERVIKEELTKKLQSMVIGGVYDVPTTLFTNTGGISQAVGPLNPAASVSSMLKVLNEPKAPAELKACAMKNGDKTTAKQMYDCSVDYFVDKECPSLAQELKEKFCDTGSDTEKEAQRANLKAQTTVGFLADFKMFQVGVGMTTESKTPVFAEVGTLKVKCNAAIITEETTETTTTITEMLKVTKPGFFRRMKKDCREERKALNQEYGRKNVRKAANQRKNPNGIVIKESSSTATGE